MVSSFVKYMGIALVAGTIGTVGGRISGLRSSYNAGYEAGAIDAENTLKALLSNLANSPNELNNNAGLSVGTVAPDFRLIGLDGNFHSLDMYKGKPVILNVWESWCGPCKTEMPEMDVFARDYDGKATVLAITSDDFHGTLNHMHYSDFVKREGLKSIQVLLDTSSSVRDNYKIIAIPTTFILDAEGRIVGTNRGLVDFSPEGPVRKTLDDLLTAGIVK